MIKKLKAALQVGNKARIQTLLKKLNADGSSPEILLQAAFFLFKDGDGFNQDALAIFDQGLSMNHQYADKAHALVREPFMQGHDDINQRILEVGIKYDPRCFSNLLELALVYIRREQFDEAESLLLRTLEIDGTRYEPIVNLTDLYLKMNRYHDAFACAQLAVEISPDPELAHYNLGIICMMTARYKEAILSFEKVLQLNPEHAEARISFGQLLLKAGNFDLGWQQLEYRWNDKQKINQIDLPLPKWEGQPLQGKGLIVWGDQGLGDSIMYACLLNRLIQSGCRVSVVCSRRLENLFNDSFDLETYYSHGDNETIKISGNYQYQISFGSLPTRLIRSFDDFAEGLPYIKANNHKVEQLKQQLQQRFPGKKLLGFTWRGGLSHTRKFARDTGLDIWQPLMAHPDYQFINLQYDISPEDEKTIINMGGFISDVDCKNDLDGLAALIKSLDLVISADNTTVHLAGALGVPVWTLLPYSSEWRWFFEEEKTHWYQSMRLFHQQKLNEWQGCFNQVEAALFE